MTGTGEIRRATEDDVGDILRLNRGGNGADIEAEMDTVFRHGGMSATDYAVAEVDGRVVATVGLLRAQLRIGTVTLPIGQPEYVATDPEHQGRGWAGRLLEQVQQWSADRGDLIQIIAGVAYFYRQYGYAYGLVRPPVLVVPPEQALTMPSGWEVRAASPDDVAAIRALQDEAQAGVDVALPFTDNLWPAFLAMPPAPLLVGVTGGRVESVARLRVGPDSPVQVQALAASIRSPEEGLRAVLAEARERHPGATLMVADRTGSATRAVVAPGAVTRRSRGWLYARVPSLAPLLRALIPELDLRLARSRYANADADVTISQYRSSVRLAVVRGHVAEVTAGSGVHEPADVGGVGIPPDLVPLLLLGEGGVAALEDHPDVFLSRSRPLMEALFPPLRLDLLTW